MRKWHLILAGLLLVAGVLIVVFLLPGDGRRRPSIVLVTMDTTRADYIGCYREGFSRTPRIDALAGRGVQFMNTDSSAPITLPSHASILTGVFPPDHGVRDNGFYRLDAKAVTLAERLREDGYRTAAFVSSVILDGKHGLDQGFEVYGDEFEAPLDTETRFPVSRRAEETITRALEWLSDLDDDEPFFLWVHFYDPHAPYDPPPPFDRAYLGSPYAGEIAYLDSQLARLLSGSRRKRGEDLVTIVTADHGESLGEHGEETHGYYVYQSTIHVPLVIAGGPFTGGRQVVEPVRTVDIPPTILHLAGLAVPQAMRGRSLIDVMEGRVADLTAYSEAWIPKSFGWSGLRAARRGGTKVIEGSRATVTDLTMDPREEGEQALSSSGRGASLVEFLGTTELPPGVDSTGSVADLTEEDVQALLGLGYLNAAGGAPASAASVVSPTLPDPRDRLKLYKMVQRARSLRAEKREAALELMSKVVAEDPVNPQLRVQRALIAIAGAHEEEALGDLRFARDHLPEDPQPPNLLGGLHHAAGRLPEAEAALRTALKRSPNHYRSLFQLGSVLLDREKYKEAADTYRHVLRIHERDALAMNNLGFALIRGNLGLEKGMAMIERAAETAPRNGEIRLSLGDALLNVGNKKDALPHLLAARDLLGARPSLLELIEKAR